MLLDFYTNCSIQSMMLHNYSISSPWICTHMTDSSGRNHLIVACWKNAFVNRAVSGESQNTHTKMQWSSQFVNRGLTVCIEMLQHPNMFLMRNANILSILNANIYSKKEIFMCVPQIYFSHLYFICGLFFYIYMQQWLFLCALKNIFFVRTCWDTFVNPSVCIR